MENGVNYSQRELDHFFLDIQNRLTRIEEQTKKTNGSVAALQGWRMYITGGLAVVVVLLVPILIFIATNYIK